MKHRLGFSLRVISYRILSAALGAFILLPGLSQAQSTSSRIVAPVDERIRVRLPGNVHPLAQPQYDQGVVPDSLPAERIFLLLQRSPVRETALQQFLQDAHTQGTPSYHKWLTPRQFGNLYGPSDSEISTVSAWLEKHGFAIARVTKGKTAIEFSGTAGQVREAFRTEIHTYAMDGERHYANNSDPQIPAALAPVIAGITPLNDFQPTPYVRYRGEAVYDRTTHKFVPQWTFPGINLFDFAPGDFALQYDLGPLYAAGINGSGVTIGLIGASNVDPSIVAIYRSFFGLQANPLNVVIDGLDPGQNYAVVESYLDVEEAGAVAPGATITLYTSAGTSVQSGLNLAAMRAVDDDVALVLSTSYGTCEQDLGSAGNQFWNALWEQAAAQGQTSFVSAGDGGPAGCDNFDNFQPAQDGIAMNGFSSTPWNVSVGGTDFYYTSYSGTSSAQQTQLQTYWDTVATLYPTTSLLQPVPEQPWNDSFGLNLSNGGVYTGNSPDIVAGSGGPSNCATGAEATDGTYSTCTAGYAKPAWQSGSGVPNDGARDLPDVSLFASSGENDSFYPVCAGPGDCVVSDGDLSLGAVGGTSASSPAMAGIMALIDQKYGPQGQADFKLYSLAAQHPLVFHDVTVGSNVVPCQSGTPNCTLSSANDNTKGFYVFGYDAGPGYDLATGLGSVDANQLVSNWNSLSFKATSTTLSLSQTSFTHGTPVTVSVGVTGGGGTPTGTASLLTNATPANSVGPNAFTLQNGAASGSVNSLPGGQYKVTARYSGDNLFATSTSAPVSVNVTPEASSLSLFGTYYVYFNNSAGVLTNGGSYPFGATLAVEAQAVGVNAPSGSTDGSATGTVTFTDSASTGMVSSGPQNMGTASTAAWVPAVFSIGTHSITASYSGDASFNASSISTPLYFTITKATPGIELGASYANYSVAAGQTVTLQVSLGGGSTAPQPTGTATFYSGTTVLGTAAVVQSTTFCYPFSCSLATLNTTNLPVGTDSVTAQYGGDANYVAATSNAVPVFVSQELLPTVTASANASSLLPTQDLIVTANVAGVSGQPAPTGSIFFYAYGPGGTSSSSCNLVNALCSNDFSGNYWSPGTVTVNVSYSGDSNYAASSTAVNETMLNMFTITAASSVSFAAGADTGNTAALTITPQNGFTGPVYFACVIVYYPPGAQHLPTCGVPNSVSVTSASPVTTAMTINSTPPTTTPSRAEGTGGPRWLVAQLSFVAGIFAIGLPLRKRVRFRATAMFLLIVVMGSIALVSCGGGTSVGGGGGGGQTVPGTTPGTYKFMVDGAYTPNTRSPEPLFYSTPQVFTVDVTIQ